MPGADDRIVIVRVADLAGPGARHCPDRGDPPALGIGGRFQVTGLLEDKASQRFAVTLRPRIGVERVGQHLDLCAVFQLGGAQDDAAPLHTPACGRLRTGGDVPRCQRAVDPAGIEGGSIGTGAQQQSHQQDAEARCCNAVTHTHSLDDRGSCSHGLNFVGQTTNFLKVYSDPEMFPEMLPYCHGRTSTERLHLRA